MNLPLRGWLVVGGLALSAALAYALLVGGLGRSPTPTVGASRAPALASDRPAPLHRAPGPRGGAGAADDDSALADHEAEGSLGAPRDLRAADNLGDELVTEEDAPPAKASKRDLLRPRPARAPREEAADGTLEDLALDGGVTGVLGSQGVGAGGGGAGALGLGTRPATGAAQGDRVGVGGAPGAAGSPTRQGRKRKPKIRASDKAPPVAPVELPPARRGASTPPPTPQAGADARINERAQRPTLDAAASRRAKGEAPPPAVAAAPARTVKPARFLPRTFYFENTYLGGDAAIAERTRRVQAALGAEGLALPLDRTTAGEQPLDPPDTDGLAVYADLDRSWLDQPGRVVLQVGLRGSDRYGWRRPPLDVVVVFAPGATRADPRGALQALASLAQRLGPRDRLGAVIAGANHAAGQAPRRFELERVGATGAWDARLREVGRAVLGAGGGGGRVGRLSAALRSARLLLARAAHAEAVVPGTRLVLLVTGPRRPRGVAAARRAADALARDGAMVSVLELTAGSAERAAGAWWRVAAAGHGNFRRAAGAGVDGAVERELADQSRVVARLVRLNIRLAKGVKAIRVLGSRVLDPREVARVKAREEAVDRQLSAAVGVKRDRGEDDDGIQTVIPYFYGGDSHVVLVELWVERPGPVADVTIRYKDMVNLSNATARASATLAGAPRASSPLAQRVLRNARGMRVAELLQRAGYAVAQGRRAQARALVEEARAAVGGEPADGDRALLEAAEALLRGSDGGSAVAEALVVAGLRRAGAPVPAPGIARGDTP